MSPATQLCTNCGRVLSPYWKDKCHHCGTPISVARPSAPAHFRDLRSEFADALVRTGYGRANARSLPGWIDDDLLAGANLASNEPMERGLLAVSDLMGSSSLNRVVLIATDRRVLRMGVSGALSSGFAMSEMPYRLLGRASISAGWKWAQVELSGLGGGRALSIDHVGKRPAQEMVTFLQSRLGNATAPMPREVRPQLVDELERLAGLRDRGALSDAEFEAAKRRLLEG